MTSDENSADKPKMENAPVAAPAEPAVAPQPAQPQNVQYVVQEKSLKGVGGWLIFFMIVFGISAVYGLIGFFGSLAGVVEGSASGVLIVNLIFLPLIAAASILSIVFIAMQKKIGQMVAIAANALNALWLTVLIPVATIAACNVVDDFYYNYTSRTVDCPGAGGWVGIIGGILVAWVAYGLFALYFYMSKRVKATLVK